MFDGTNTAGWFNPFHSGRAWAENGQILLAGDKKFFLVSRQSYTNFILTADILIPDQGRSGLQFRSSYGDNSVNGYKADVTNSASIRPGGLWSQSRGWLDRPSHTARVVPAPEWNHYEVEAIDDNITILVNNTVTVNTVNSLFTSGRIALFPAVSRLKRTRSTGSTMLKLKISAIETMTEVFDDERQISSTAKIRLGCPVAGL